jgi:hypothetical protein
MNAAANEAAAYARFAERVRDEGLLSDPWLDGQPRFVTTSWSDWSSGMADFLSPISNWVPWARPCGNALPRAGTVSLAPTCS